MLICVFLWDFQLAKSAPFEYRLRLSIFFQSANFLLTDWPASLNVTLANTYI